MQVQNVLAIPSQAPILFSEVRCNRFLPLYYPNRCAKPQALRPPIHPSNPLQIHGQKIDV